MKTALMIVIAAGLVAAPVQAADWSDVRPGTFVGARLTIGGTTGGKPSAELTIAPTQNRISNGGMVRTTAIGEGFALNFSPQSKPTLTLAGVRADTALGLRPHGQGDSDQQLGLSKGSKIAIGGAVALAAAAGTAFIVLSNRCTECDQ